MNNNDDAKAAATWKFIKFLISPESQAYWNAETGYFPVTRAADEEQTFKDMEILVVNDGSTDESLAICQEYAQMDPRFHIINKENTGVSDSRNRAIQIAKGDYLQFMDLSLIHI